MPRTPRKEDIKVGERIRLRRHLLNVTQKDLAGQIGVKFQQVQKYETGANRVGASRMMDIARALKTHPSWFFDDQIEPGMETGALTPDEISLLQSFRTCRGEARVSALNIVAELSSLSASNPQPTA